MLFNGGVVKSEVLRQRLLETLNEWLIADGASPARVLPGEDPDLAVARGAAYFGRVRAGKGLRIRGGTARGYYVGIESPMPAVPGMEPPIFALCVAPFGLEEGSAAALPPQELAVVVGEPRHLPVLRLEASGAPTKPAPCSSAGPPERSRSLPRSR